jgi:Zn-dependent metalloprotease
MRILPFFFFGFVVLFLAVMICSSAAWAASGKTDTNVLDPQGIERLKRDAGPESVVSLSPVTGGVRFLSFDGAPAKAGLARSAGTLQERSMAFLRDYGSVFGLRNAAQELQLRKEQKDRLGWDHFSYKQHYLGVPVFAGELKVHYDSAGNLRAINGTIVPDINLNTNPDLKSDDASKIALGKVEIGKKKDDSVVVKATQLHVYRTGLAQGIAGKNHLVWEVEIGNGSTVRDFVYIDAHSGEVVDRVKGIMDALDRRAFDGKFETDVPPTNYPDNPFWVEGDPFPTGTTEADNMILSSKETYDFYFKPFGRDSFDGLGSTMDAIFNRGDACPNASWNSAFISFCNGLTNDDVTGHEWTHAYTEFTHNLIYAWQPGALNESYSDIFGETIDQINGRGTDTPNNPRTDGECSNAQILALSDNSVRWLIGEDDTAPGLEGPLRDMWTPTCFDNPGKVSDPEYFCSTGDSGGVHENSGVPNHAYALLVDGGSYNNKNITGIGLTKAASIYFRAMTVYQGPATDFADHADAIIQSAKDLIGTDAPDLLTGQPSGQVFTKKDVKSVKKALKAVEMQSPSPCGEAPLLGQDPPKKIACEQGSKRKTLFKDNFEGDVSQWTTFAFPTDPSTWTPREWVVVSDLPDNRKGSAFFAADPNHGSCINSSEEAELDLVSPAILLPADITHGTVLQFEHNVATEAGIDGGLLFIRVNGGNFNLVPAESFIYNAPNVDGVAWSGTDLGTVEGSWATTLVDISSLAGPGDTIVLAWAMFTDCDSGDLGWWVDDVNLSFCKPKN